MAVAYHAVAHQAGFISRSSQANESISLYFRKVVVETMLKLSSVCLEIGMSNLQWLHKQLEILKPSTWGGDLEVRLLAIGLQRVLLLQQMVLPLPASILHSHHQ